MTVVVCPDPLVRDVVTRAVTFIVPIGIAAGFFYRHAQSRDEVRTDWLID